MNKTKAVGLRGAAACPIALFLSLALAGCIAPNQLPVAVIDASKTSAQSGGRISFDAYDSYDPDGSIGICTWSFGDGASDTGKFVSHVFSSPGTYTVRLTVQDDQGATGVASTQVTITQGPRLSDFRVTRTEWKPSRCWLIVSWPCVYAYATVASTSPLSARIEVDVTAYDSMGAAVGTGTLYGSSCNLPPTQTFVVEGKIFDIWGPVESVSRVDARVTSVSPCD